MNGRKSRFKELNDKEWLYQKYHIEGLTQKQIANIIGCKRSTVSMSFVYFHISTRGYSERAAGERNPMFGIHFNGKKHWNWKGGKIEITCPVCGEKKYIDKYKVKKNKDNCCSHYCSRKMQKIPKHHTKPELIFEQIRKKYSLPYRYTGDGSFWIGKNPSVNPDFVDCNGKKIAVEIFSYWHDPLRRFGKVRYSATYSGRKKILKEYGWELVVFWQEDLERKDAEHFVLNKIKGER